MYAKFSTYDSFLKEEASENKKLNGTLFLNRVGVTAFSSVVYLFY